MQAQVRQLGEENRTLRQQLDSALTELRALEALHRRRIASLQAELVESLRNHLTCSNQSVQRLQETQQFLQQFFRLASANRSTYANRRNEYSNNCFSDATVASTRSARKLKTPTAVRKWFIVASFCILLYFVLGQRPLNFALAPVS
eukprot:GILK01013178.1.p1 GENE.GILK01013178.1~~GILK01013178.1.p1  ORF type:complete len:146 (-),score=8.79 GILK01013178.1:111-548(-)